MRYFIQLAYDGGAYHGWQAQPGSTTVQQRLEAALSMLLKQPTALVGSGRTDAGVHACQQWAHWDQPLPLSPGQQQGLVYRLNCLLPADIGIQGLYAPANPGLHARYDATRRQYRYQICRTKNPHLRGQSLLHTGPLDTQAMDEAAACLMQYTDFASVCKSGGNNQTTLCTLLRSDWHYGPGLWTYTVAANRFLRGMVRALVGTMLLVGRGRMHLDELRAAIEAKDRSRTGPAAPPEGLFLEQVAYPEGSLIRIDE